MFRWLGARGARERQVDRVAQQITPELWQQTLRTYPFLQGLDAAELHELQLRSAWLLASKSFSAAQGMSLSDEILLAIAVQAALPILRLDPVVYEGWSEIVVYPAGFLVSRQEVDDAGVVHEFTQEVSGEAWDGGPVILSWQDAAHAGHGANVVIHEFTHKLDLHGGEAEGMPGLSAHPELTARRWLTTLQQSYDRFVRALEAVEKAIPRDVDPESTAGWAWYERLPLDPYAATDTAEFFAVSAEAFFVDPEPLAAALPEWYGLLAMYFRQNPLERRERTAVR